MEKYLKQAIERHAAACQLDVKTAYIVIERVLIRLPALEYDEDFTLEELCGDMFWARYQYVGRRIGLFFARMVRNGHLPLRLSRIRSDHHRLYRRT